MSIQAEHLRLVAERSALRVLLRGVAGFLRGLEVALVPLAGLRAQVEDAIDTAGSEARAAAVEARACAECRGSGALPEGGRCECDFGRSVA